jgi:hypothetical protein
MDIISAKQHAQQLFQAATPVIRIHGVGGRQWKRNVAKGPRVGPWLQGRYDILDDRTWRTQGACLYLVVGSDAVIRYVGISRNRLKDRWRTSPAYDAQTMERLPRDQIFHSQCWKHIERESRAIPGLSFEVRAISPAQIASMDGRLAKFFSSLTLDGQGDGEGIVTGIERWLCNHQAADLVSWNVAGTARTR